MRRLFLAFIFLIIFSPLLSATPVSAADCSFTIGTYDTSSKMIPVTISGPAGNNYKVIINNGTVVTTGVAPNFTWGTLTNVQVGSVNPGQSYLVSVSHGDSLLCDPSGGLSFTVPGSTPPPSTPPPSTPPTTPPPGTPSDCSGSNPAAHCGLPTAGGSAPSQNDWLSVFDPLSGKNNGGNFTVGSLITKFFNSLIIFAGMLAVLIVIWGGFKYLTAQGDEKAMSSARGTITGAVIGLIIILSLGVIGFVLGTVLKINIFNG